MKYETITVDPITPVIGAEIGGVDLSEPMGNQTFQEVHDALMRHQVIFFRDQDMSLDEHKAFGRQFGELHVHPAAPAPEGHPEILVIHADENSKHVAGHGWHSDVSCDPEPPMGSILHLRKTPDSGGDTMFSSMYAAYDGLSDSMKSYLESLTAIHASEHVYRGRYGQTESLRDGDYPENEHPIIRTHPVTRRKGLYVNSGFTRRIVGLTRRESDTLLNFLFDHVRTPEYHVRFRWDDNSVAFWDNRCVQHHALWDYYPAVRSGFRVTVKGDRPFFDPDATPLMDYASGNIRGGGYGLAAN
ncbi:MAG: TauD/TfdA family dioxygenase [Gammaproteobacteria bacterium]|nr:TauD/TfdA family dioxygenase [Gammaproteobacteria bacterium]